MDSQSENTSPQTIEINSPEHNPAISVQSPQPENTLTEAWRRFAQYDGKAQSQQTTYKRYLLSTLVLGVLGTLFVLTQKQLGGVVDSRFNRIAVALILITPLALATAFTVPKRFRSKVNRILILWWIVAVAVFAALLALAVWVGAKSLLTYMFTSLGYVILLVPIIVSVLLSASNRFKPGKKWILLRGSAETIKKEIFRYRTQVGEYDETASTTAPGTPRPTRDEALAEKIGTISRRLMQTEVNTASLPSAGRLPPKNALAKTDDGFSFLTAERYIDVRLSDQLNYYSSKAAKLERQMLEFQWAIFVIGGLGTLLAALGAQLWIAGTTALVTALTAYIGHLQLDNTLIKYNQSAADLSNLQVWWNALPSEAKVTQKGLLVEQSEKVLENELSGWVQQMEDALVDLRASPEGSKKKE